MGKKLKLWNGRGHGKYSQTHHLSVAAYSRSHAAELITKACGLFKNVGAKEIQVYYSQCWGTSLKDANPGFPCVYAEEVFGGKTPRLVLIENRIK